ncbi:hypothetical protein [Craurococcus roseus]
MTIDEICKERIKPSATFLNTTAAGCVVAGIITPMATLLLGLASARVTVLGGTVLVCALGPISAGLHWLARRVLRRIRQ